MTSTEIAAQIIGIIAMTFSILSYQGKTQKSILAMQLCGTALFFINYVMLGSVAGGILNMLGAIRALLFLFKDKLKTDRLPWLIAFIVSYIMVYVLNFTMFGKELTVFNLIIELLPVIGMIALTIGFRLKDAAAVRKFGLINSPAWLIYNITVGSWGAILCEALALISIFIGIYRHDKKGHSA